jgi:hypothetical protein
MPLRLSVSIPTPRYQLRRRTTCNTSLEASTGKIRSSFQAGLVIPGSAFSPSIPTTPRRPIPMASRTLLPLLRTPGLTMDEAASMFTTASCSWEIFPRLTVSR